MLDNRPWDASRSATSGEAARSVALVTMSSTMATLPGRCSVRPWAPRRYAWGPRGQVLTRREGAPASVRYLWGHVHSRAHRSRRLSALVGRIVIGVQRDQPEEVTVAVGDGAHLLAQAQGIHSRAVRSLEVLDRFPAEPCMSVEAGPVELAEAPQRRDDLFQLRQLEPEEDILELGAVEVQANPARRAGHASVRRPSCVASPARRSRSP